jgi:hypothetical protein
MTALPGHAFAALIATIVMTGTMQVGQGLGFSRMSLPFLLGTWVTGRRPLAMVLGALLSLLGGGLFAIGYFLVFEYVVRASWWLGSALGFLHGLAILLIFMPLLPYYHPRVATEYDEPTSARRIEPPGFFGLNYGVGTPAVLLVAQTAYGAVLGAGYSW